MDVYETLYRAMSPNDWECFAVDVLQCVGFQVLRAPAVGQDGGSDALLQRGETRYILSCKYTARAVGTDMEVSILDRIAQQDASGFVGFYSSWVTSSLQARFEALTATGVPCHYFDRTAISGLLARGAVPADLVQKYASPLGAMYPLHSDPGGYRPLHCPECGADILEPTHIPWSAAGIVQNRDGAWDYVYGHKMNIWGGSCDRVQAAQLWIELSQALHIDQLLRWQALVDETVKGGSLAETFMQNRHHFESLILQRQYPPNWGRWI